MQKFNLIIVFFQQILEINLEKDGDKGGFQQAGDFNRTISGGFSNLKEFKGFLNSLLVPFSETERILLYKALQHTLQIFHCKASPIFSILKQKINRLAWYGPKRKLFHLSILLKTISSKKCKALDDWGRGVLRYDAHAAGNSRKGGINYGAKRIQTVEL